MCFANGYKEFRNTKNSGKITKNFKNRWKYLIVEAKNNQWFKDIIERDVGERANKILLVKAI